MWSPMSPSKDIFYMKKALLLAAKAQKNGEVPVGALLVDPQGQIVSTGYNRKEQLTSPLGHAELIAIQRASQRLKKWRLTDLTLYVTLEPCPMCAGALVQARLGQLVFGARDPKAGAIESLYQLGTDPRLNHRIKVYGGVLAEECGQILKNFFQSKRKKENKHGSTESKKP